MYDTGGTRSVCRPAPADYNVGARLSWLKAELARDELRREMLHGDDEEERVLSMRQPLSPEEAYANFGMLLGLLPPAALFTRLFWHDSSSDAELVWLLLCLVMNTICCYVGLKVGGAIGRKVGDPRDHSWPLLLLVSLLIGPLWGIVTGAAGGAVVFGIGAVFGAACAVPVALLGFALFTPLHRALSCGGMIEARRLWPLAYGIATAIAALILSPHVFPY